MSILDESLNSGNRKKLNNISADLLRDEVLKFARDFKTSWVSLGQSLYSVWKDKMFTGWGFDKFEEYTQKELGIRKETAMKLLKTYFFIEQDEPQYLSKEFQEERQPVQVPHYETMNLLRLAKNNKELNKQDYLYLKKDIFEKGKDVQGLRKDLVALIKQRKVVDPDEERHQRSQDAIRRLLTAAQTFKRDMETLKLVSPDVLEETDRFIKKLEQEID
jgi:hypothetical protein